jgi:ribonucleoside-diphosphate reductase beta chain
MRQNFQTISNGLNRDHVMFRLWEKAKRLGIWNPTDIDFTQDKHDWKDATESERDLTLHVTTLFLSGEEAVTLDLLPLIGVITREGKLEEEMYLTSFLWEEAKHVDFFRRYLDEVMTDGGDLSRYHGDSYKTIFYDELPAAMGRLREDDSPLVQAEAAVTYNMVVEGMLAETGYHGWYQILEQNGLMPGMSQGIGFVQKDESRHLRFGIYLLSRLVAEYGDSVWEAVENKMTALLVPAIGIINELFDYQEALFGKVAFDLKRDDFVEYAMVQFQKRMDRIEKARSQTVEEILFREASDED